MTGATHISVGILAAVIQYTITGESRVDGVIIGSLLPDIDHYRSIAADIWPMVSRPLKWIQKWSRIFDHRQITHCILLPLLVYIICPCGLTMGIGIGWGSHLLADMLNKKGVPLFLPLSYRRYNLAHIKTGGRWEIALNWCIWIGVIYIWVML
jgi:inner membrane protein